jgi:hypothetical protein
MQALSATELLGVWERGRDLRPFQRALALLSVANPDLALETLAELPIGERDAALFTLREWMFGSQIASVVDCPACGGHLDLAFGVTDIRAGHRPAPAEALMLSVGGYDLRFRLPNSADIAALDAEQKDPRQQILARCLIDVRADAGQLDDRLPPEVEAALLQHMASADPLSDVQLALSCPTCSHEWQAPFDIVSFFWSEIESWAHRVLREIHVLASAYGWREADILRLSPLRRRIYLELIGT